MLLLFICLFIHSLAYLFKKKKKASPNLTFPSRYHLISLLPFRAKLLEKEHKRVFNKWYQFLGTPSNMETR